MKIPAALALALTTTVAFGSSACFDSGRDAAPSSLSRELIGSVRVSLVRQMAANPDLRLSQGHLSFLEGMNRALGPVDTQEEALVARARIQVIADGVPGLNLPPVGSSGDDLSSAEARLEQTPLWREFVANLARIGDLPSAEAELAGPFTLLLSHFGA